MEPYIDIHSHLLPQIDDGAEDFETSMKMMSIAAENNIERIIVTPHNKPMRRCASPSTIRKLVKELEQEARRRGIGIQLYAGNELYYRSSLGEEITAGCVCTMADSKYVLAEFGPMDGYDHIRNGIYSLMAAGYHPILAHVERYAKICTEPERAQDLVNMGCCLQVNVSSIMGKMGFGTKSFVKKLLKRRLVHFVATDAHDGDRRRPEIAGCASYIEKRHGNGYMREIFYENPMRVIGNENIPL